MTDKRKIKLRRIEKKLAKQLDKYPDIHLNDLQLLRDINEYHELKREAFFLKFEIEHCPNCSQLLPKYKKLKTQTNE